MRFAGFPKETLDYLQALNANNSKPWFEANRKTYETVYLRPALDLIETLAPFLSDLDPPHHAVPKLNKSLRRINRDTRFSKDKTPYQPRIHLVFWTGEHPNRSAGIHLVLAHDHFGYGAGHWAFEKEALNRYRKAVLNPAKQNELEKALLTAAKVGCTLGEPDLVRPPRMEGIDPGELDAQTSSLLRYKGLVARTHGQTGFDPRLFEPEAETTIKNLCKALAPLNHWIAHHVERD